MVIPRQFKKKQRPVSAKHRSLSERRTEHLCYTEIKNMKMLKKIAGLRPERPIRHRCRVQNLTILLIIFWTDSERSAVIKTNKKGVYMKRRKVNFKKSANQFKKTAQRTHKKNLPNHRVARGGIRL